MIWVDLKIHLAPLFMKQIDEVSKRYISNFIYIHIIYHILKKIELIRELRTNSDGKILKEFNSLRQSIKNRIIELEEFYEDNFDNELIIYFEKGRYKLKKLLMYEPNLLEEIDNGKNMKALVFSQKSLISQPNPDVFVDQDTEITKFSNNFFMNKNNSKSYQIFSENNVLATKNNNYNNNKTNTSNNTNDKPFKNNLYNKNRIQTYNNINSNSKSNINSKINNKSNLSFNYCLNDFQKNVNKYNKTNNTTKNSNINNKNKKNNFYKGYYNKEIRTKAYNTNSDEDTEEKKENKVKYLDWTENNTIQQNSISNNNTLNNINNSNANIENNFSNNSFHNKNNKKLNKKDFLVEGGKKGNRNSKDFKNEKNKNKKSEQIKEKDDFLNISNNPKYSVNDENMNQIKDLENKDKNFFKINFYSNVSDKEKSLSDISSNRKGENEESNDSNGNSLNKYQYKELLFQIKLTKEEYHSLIRAKAKIINPLK